MSADLGRWPISSVIVILALPLLLFHADACGARSVAQGQTVDQAHTTSRANSKSPGRFTLTREAIGYEGACRDVKDFLNSPEWQPKCTDYRACRIDYVPDDYSISLPRWVRLEPEKNMEIVKVLTRFRTGLAWDMGLSTVTPETTWDQEQGPLIRNALATHNLLLSRAEFDVDGDGDIEPVFRLDNRNCGVSGNEKTCFVVQAPLEGSTLTYDRSTWNNARDLTPLIYRDSIVWLEWLPGATYSRRLPAIYVTIYAHRVRSARSSMIGASDVVCELATKEGQ